MNQWNVLNTLLPPIISNRPLSLLWQLTWVFKQYNDGSILLIFEKLVSGCLMVCTFP